MITPFFVKGFIRHGMFIINPSDELLALIKEQLTDKMKKQLKENFQYKEEDMPFADYIFVVPVVLGELQMAVVDGGEASNMTLNQIVTSIYQEKIVDKEGNLTKPEAYFLNSVPLELERIKQSFAKFEKDLKAYGLLNMF